MPTHFALVAVDEEGMIPLVEHNGQSVSDFLVRNGHKWLLVSRNADLDEIDPLRSEEICILLWVIVLH